MPFPRACVTFVRCLSLLAIAGSLHAQPATRRMRAADVDSLPVRDPGRRIAYGSDSLQFGELRVPPGRGPFPVAIVVHGGCWYSPYASVRNSAPLADALASSGVATWNVEYRRYDQPGGGWPGTLRDVASAADHLRRIARAYSLDTSRVVAVGHSAGGQLALWLATRITLGAESPLRTSSHPISIRGVVSVGGIADLREFHIRERATCGVGAVESLLGAAPDSVAERVRDASPSERLPLRVPSVHIAGDGDRIAPLAVRESFAEAARRAGDSAEVITVPDAGHFEPMAPATAAGRAVVEAVLRMLRPGARTR